MTHVWLLWDEGWDYSVVVSVYGSLPVAKAGYLDSVHPLLGPRGGKRPPRPLIAWTSDDNGDTWYPFGGDPHYHIERREVNEA